MDKHATLSSEVHALPYLVVAFLVLGAMRVRCWCLRTYDVGTMLLGLSGTIVSWTMLVWYWRNDVSVRYWGSLERFWPKWPVWIFLSFEPPCLFRQMRAFACGCACAVLAACAQHGSRCVFSRFLGEARCHVGYFGIFLFVRLIFVFGFRDVFWESRFRTRFWTGFLRGSFSYAFWVRFFKRLVFVRVFGQVF